MKQYSILRHAVELHKDAFVEPDQFAKFLSNAPLKTTGVEVQK